MIGNINMKTVPEFSVEHTSHDYYSESDEESDYHSSKDEEAKKKN